MFVVVAVFFVVIAVCYFSHVVIVLVCHVVTKIVLDEMGHLHTLLDQGRIEPPYPHRAAEGGSMRPWLDKMGLDEMGLDEMV